MNEEKKVNSSIVYKLNTWHLSQLFASFLCIDMIIIVLFSGALLYHAESEITNRAKTITRNEMIMDNATHGIKLPEVMQSLVPMQMQKATRNLETVSYGTFWDKVYGIKYKVWVPYQNSFFVLDFDMGSSLGLFLRLLIVLLIFELMIFISSIGKGARSMRRALRPIAQLTETAQIMNKTPDYQLRDLMGTIDTINATRLDTRVKVGSTQDELKDLAGAINGMLERIDEAYRSQVRFVSDASHELRTPIAVIQGYANLLDRWGKNDEKALLESIAAIKSEANSMKDLVEQLLFLARGDNDSMQLSMENIDLNSLVSEVLRETVMIDPSHEFSSKIGEDITIIGDAQLIKQAIRIFVDNSIKYTPAGGAISVTTMRDGDFAKVSVQDDGIGIPSEDVPYVFDRFFRSDDSRARKTGGTGLGLAIAKWIVDRHGGTVEVLSRKDIGTRITVSLKIIR